MLKGNALIRHSFHIDPGTLTPEKWAQLFAEALWIEKRKMENMGRLLSTLFSNGQNGE